SRHVFDARLERYRDLPLHLFGGIARLLRDDLDQRGRRVGIGFYVEILQSKRAARQQGGGQRDHHYPLAQHYFDQSVHRISNTAPFVTIRSPTFKPLLIITLPSTSWPISTF